MDHYSKQDQEFLDGVWSKVRYLEYVQAEQQQIKQNARRLRTVRFKLAALLMTAVIMISIPILLLNGFDLGSIIGIGVLVLGAGAFYEYGIETETDRRATHDRY